MTAADLGRPIVCTAGHYVGHLTGPIEPEVWCRECGGWTQPSTAKTEEVQGDA